MLDDVYAWVAPDFEALRRRRNEGMSKLIRSIYASLGGDPAAEPMSTFNPASCYCACPDGPCEHRWEGSRPVFACYTDDDGVEQSYECGSEQVCARCGAGAMSHFAFCL